MKSRMLIEMMSALSLVLLTIMATATYGQGYGGIGMSGMGGMDGGLEMGIEGQITRPSLSYTIDDKPYQATRVRSFRYVYQSFRPKELAYVNNDGSAGGYGISGGYPGRSGEGGYNPGATGDVAGYGTSSSGQASNQAFDHLTIKIHAYLFDSEKVNDRTRIELMIKHPNEMGLEGMPGGKPSGPPWMKPLSSLGTPKTEASARLSQSEINLVTDIICQAIWKADVVKALFASKGQGDSAAENEKLLKLLLAEQYDTQLARQEMEAESIKRRLELLVDELKRRKLAKDRVVDVQLGRLILDAQGLLNNDR